MPPKKYVFDHTKNLLEDLTPDEKNTLLALLSTITKSSGFVTLFDLIKNSAVNAVLENGAGEVATEHFHGYFQGICVVEDFIKNNVSLSREATINKQP